MTKQTGTARGAFRRREREQRDVPEARGSAARNNHQRVACPPFTDILPRFGRRARENARRRVMCVFPSADLAVLAASE